MIDEINVFNKVLDLAEIQAVQKAPAYKPAVVEPVVIPADEPANQTVFVGNPATFRVNASGSPPLSYQWWKRQPARFRHLRRDQPELHARGHATLADSGNEYWVVVTNPAEQRHQPKAVLTVLAEDNHKVFLSFSEGSGTATANLGNIGGSATLGPGERPARLLDPGARRTLRPHGQHVLDGLRGDRRRPGRPGHRPHRCRHAHPGSR